LNVIAPIALQPEKCDSPSPSTFRGMQIGFNEQCEQNEPPIRVGRNLLSKVNDSIALVFKSDSPAKEDLASPSTLRLIQTRLLVQIPRPKTETFAISPGSTRLPRRNTSPIPFDVVPWPAGEGFLDELGTGSLKARRVGASPDRPLTPENPFSPKC
jgi:hypothetical protein